MRNGIAAVFNPYLATVLGLTIVAPLLHPAAPKDQQA